MNRGAVRSCPIWGPCLGFGALIVVSLVGGMLDSQEARKETLVFGMAQMCAWLGGGSAVAFVLWRARKREERVPLLDGSTMEDPDICMHCVAGVVLGVLFVGATLVTYSVDAYLPASKI